MSTKCAAAVLLLSGSLAWAEPPGAAPAPTPEVRGLLSPVGTLGADVYKKRRAQVLEKLGKSATVVFDEMQYTTLREGMDFYWLTGFSEPGAALLLDPNAPQDKEILFLAPRDVEEERWNGERAPLPSLALEKATGISRIRRTNRLAEALLTACDHNGELAFVGEYASVDQPQSKALDLLRKTTERTVACKLKDLHRLVSKLRTVKSPAEVALLKKAVAYSAEGHRAAMAAAKAGAPEFAIKDAAEAAMRKAGMRHLAYDSITGSGPNGAVLHYPKDDRVMKANDLVVADIGAEAEFYAADVTRTFPVGGKFTAEQRAVYEAVLKPRPLASPRPSPACRSPTFKKS